MKQQTRNMIPVIAMTGALSLAAAPLWAQQSGGKTAPSSQSRQQSQMSRNLVSAESMKDQKVVDAQNREVGTISGVYINPQSGRVERAGIEFSGSMFGRDHKYSVAWDKLKVRQQGENMVVTLDQSVIQRVQQAGKTGRVQEGEGIYAWQDESRSTARSQQGQKGGMAGIGDAGKQQQTIAASQLSSEQIRKIQQKLNQQGFHAGQVDGNWSSETQSAIRNFQQTKGINATGQLDEKTLDELGLDADEFRQSSQQRGNRSGGQPQRSSGSQQR